MVKKHFCRVCGEKLELLKDNKYLVEVKKMEGILPIIKYYECFDCQRCGCQNILNIREGKEVKEKGDE